MLLPPIPAQSVPRDLTPKNAVAKTYLGEETDLGPEVSDPNLRSSLLPPGDVKVRLWDNLRAEVEGMILRRRKAKWSAARIIQGSFFPERPLPAPKLGWPAFLCRAESLGLFTLPDQTQARSLKGYHFVFDGDRTFVEYQKDGVYRAYAYDNPDWQNGWPPAKRMVALLDFIRSQFPR